MIRAAMAVRLKEQMGTENIRIREEQLLERTFSGLDPSPGCISWHQTSGTGLEPSRSILTASTITWL